MTRLILEIPQKSALRALLPLLQYLHIHYFEIGELPAEVVKKDAKEAIKDLEAAPSDDRLTQALRIIRQGCDMSDFGDALQYQIDQRHERELPYRD